EADANLPAGAVAPNADGSAPEGYPIKGNADSGLYHVPGSRSYERTVAELYFATAEDAEAAGFQLPPSQRERAADEAESPIADADEPKDSGVEDATEDAAENVDERAAERLDEEDN